MPWNSAYWICFGLVWVGKPASSLRLGTQATTTHGPTLYYKHLTKAGGTFGRRLIETVFLSRANFAIDEDDSGLPPENARRNLFLAVSMRNPCDLYLSYMHFHPAKAFSYGPTFGPNPVGKAKGPFAVDQLKEWLLNARLPGHTGFYSYYMWSLLIRPECADWHRRRNETRPSADLCDNEEQIRSDLGAFSPKTLAQCWIFMETMMDDFRTCFEAYEQSLNLPGGAINWKLFNQIAANQSIQDELLADGHQHADKLSSKQRERHKPCGEYFSSRNMSALVHTSDPDLFEKFGYHQCCMPSSHHIM